MGKLSEGKIQQTGLNVISGVIFSKEEAVPELRRTRMPFVDGRRIVSDVRSASVYARMKQ